MKSPAELISELSETINSMEDEIMSIIEYAALLSAVVTPDEPGSRKDAKQAGAHRLLLTIGDHGKTLQDAHDVLHSIANRLANP